jgi:hypothetical protein
MDVETIPLQDIINAAHDHERVDIDGTLMRGTIHVTRPILLNFLYPDGDEEYSSRGSVYVISSGVKLTGLRLRGRITVESPSDEVVIEKCVIQGYIKLGQGTRAVTISSCEISSADMGPGIYLPSGCISMITNCRITDCLVGISIHEEAYVASSDPPSLLCRLQSCHLERNSTDIVILMRLTADIEGESSCLDTSRILDVSADTELSTIEVSLTGRFAAPISFTSWPLDLGSLPQSVPRRGFKTNGRYCHLHVDGQRIMVIEDQPSVSSSPGTGRPRKRKECTPVLVSKAEVYYSRILGIEPGSSKNSIMDAYKKLALQTHPDKGETDSDKFIRIKRARDELMKLVNSR